MSSASLTVLYQFTATWCAPCKMMAPIVEEVIRGLNVELFKLDIEDNDEMVKRYKVRSVPTFLLVKDNVVQATKIGSCSKEKFIKWLEENNVYAN